MQVGWLLDRDADLHVNEDQPLFEAAYHGAVPGGPCLGWKQCGLSRCGGWPRAECVGLELPWAGTCSVADLFVFLQLTVASLDALVASTQGMRVW